MLYCNFGCFPDDDPLGVETCRNILCYIVTLVVSVMTIRWGSKRVGILNVILQYKYLRNNTVHFVGLSAAN
jgi:hypothetical protein